MASVAQNYLELGGADTAYLSSCLNTACALVSWLLAFSLAALKVPAPPRRASRHIAPPPAEVDN